LGNPYIVGRNHLKFRVRDGQRDFECIGFGMGDRLGEMNGRGSRIDLAYIPERNDWQGVRRLQLRVRDFLAL
jgi:single-stranded-DNA-specific exonuclease